MRITGRQEGNSRSTDAPDIYHTMYGYMVGAILKTVGEPKGRRCSYNLFFLLHFVVLNSLVIIKRYCPLMPLILHTC